MATWRNREKMNTLTLASPFAHRQRIRQDEEFAIADSKVPRRVPASLRRPELLRVLQALHGLDGMPYRFTEDTELAPEVQAFPHE
jgi:hypothetical protein